MKLALSAITVMLSVVTAVSTAHAADALSPNDRAFIAKVSQGGMFEVEAGQLASTQGSTQDIKDQGSTEAHDHQLVGDKLKSIASDADVTFPSSLNNKFQAELDDLKKLSGVAFDAAYLRDMKEIHAIDGAAFKSEAASTSYAPLKAFASETHRIVLRHIGELNAIGPAA
jgi:putative membrane protein